ncbi:DUF3951 domain-containing protein [Halobacillus fulvus]|nr:DUF3951 domain-containing protein [Halobacillus fulvus]
MIYILSIFSIAFIVLILIVAYRVFIKKANTSNYYTPFDHITGQSVSEFQEENVRDEQVEERDQGDDKDK